MVLTPSRCRWMGEDGSLAELLLDTFVSADLNGDGLISRAESLGMFPELTEAQFDTLDTDSDGYLSEPELRAASLVGGCMSPESGGDFFADGLVLYLLAWADTIQRRLARMMGWTLAEDTETD